jgi:hypothetical protein
MKKITFICAMFIMLFTGTKILAQSVGIGSGAFVPAVSSMLEVQATGQGILIPRMVWASKPPAPVTSLLIFSTDGDGVNGPGYYYWDGVNWVKLFAATNANGVYTFENALTETNPNIVRWGGTLLQNTTVTQDVYNTIFNLNSTGDFDIQDNGTSAFFVRDDGYVGINMNAPTTRLYVNGAAAVTAILGYYNATIYGTVGSSNSGIFGTSNINTGAGVFGDGNTATNGVYGQTNTATYGAIEGYNSNTIGDAITAYGGAVAGGSHSGNGDGVAATTDGTGFGVIGSNYNGVNYSRYGLLGSSNNGVYGTSDNNTGAGVFGNGGTATNGVYALSNNASYAAVETFNSNTLGDGIFSYGGNMAGGGSHSAQGDGVVGNTDGTGFGTMGAHYNGVDYNRFGALGGSNFGAYGQNGTIYGYLGTTNAGAAGTYNANIFGQLGNATGGAYGQNTASFYGYLGLTSYGAAGYATGATVATYGVYGYHSNSTAATGYGISNTMDGICGYTYWGQAYHFGVSGYRYDDAYNRTGGVIGGSSNGNPPTAWGSLGYKNSGGVHYGVYGSVAYASGAGFMEQKNISQGIAGGFYGGVMGSWSRGDVLGFTSMGEIYASYNIGNEYTSGISADIVTSGDKRVAMYSVTSNDVKVYADGTSQLVNGSCRVNFEQSFIDVSNAEKTPTVTISPLGPGNGIYIESIDSRGFTVKEQNNGNSNVQFSWIAISKRIDAPQNNNLPAVLADKNFDKNLTGVMFNESITDRNATPIWWDGSTLRFDAIPEKINSNKKEESGVKIVAEKPQPSLTKITGKPNKSFEMPLTKSVHTLKK